MATEVLLTQWDMGMLDGTVVRWLKREGDPIQEGEELAEIEAAKATEVLLAPASGTLARIVAPEGETVLVRAVLCIIAQPGETIEATPAVPAARVEVEPRPPTAAVQVEPRARRLAQE